MIVSVVNNGNEGEQKKKKKDLGLRGLNESNGAFSPHSPCGWHSMGQPKSH